MRQDECSSLAAVELILQLLVLKTASYIMLEENNYVKVERP